jgi:hypothetical protein
MPNESPAVSAAGHACRSPRRPSAMNSRMNGTMNARLDVCRPVIAPMCPAIVGSLGDRTVIGLPRPPNATGAVSATRAMATALSGEKPIAMSMTAQIAMGEPPPASASISAPNENAITSAWTRWSPLTLAKVRRSTAKCPVSTVML